MHLSFSLKCDLEYQSDSNCSVALDVCQETSA